MNDLPKQEIIRFPASRIVDVAKALSGDVRVRILEALGDQPMSVGQLAEALGVAQPTISINVQMLEQAELVSSTLGANREKICSVNFRQILLELPTRPGDGLNRIESIDMPIGLYASCSVQPTCGMAAADGSLIGSADDPRAFFMPERVEAQLLWFANDGWVEYLFANPLPPGAELAELRISAELCSEAPAFQMEWLSDITLMINGQSLGTWTSPADYGDRKGKLTPERWRSGTEYGQLTEWRINADGSYIGDARSTDTTLAELGLSFNQPIAVRFAVLPDALNRNGINLFGHSFGDHPQSITLSFVRKLNEAAQ